jgi:hypothetical protein
MTEVIIALKKRVYFFVKSLGLMPSVLNEVEWKLSNQVFSCEFEASTKDTKDLESFFVHLLDIYQDDFKDPNMDKPFVCIIYSFNSTYAQDMKTWGDPFSFNTENIKEVICAI